ncbi:hypothetical protein G6F24_018062 [Rhizopus arrhizus]|nr:hypothetical protein G6F24_018062 [Rhizopus arrhizus]
MVRAAFRAMTTGKPGAAHLCFPYDVMTQQVDASDVWAQPEHGQFPSLRFAPDPADVARAAQRLVGARAPRCLADAGRNAEGRGLRDGQRAGQPGRHASAERRRGGLQWRRDGHA